MGDHLHLTGASATREQCSGPRLSADGLAWPAACILLTLLHACAMPRQTGQAPAPSPAAVCVGSTPDSQPATDTITVSGVSVALRLPQQREEAFVDADGRWWMSERKVFFLSSPSASPLQRCAAGLADCIRHHAIFDCPAQEGTVLVEVGQFAGGLFGFYALAELGSPGKTVLVGEMVPRAVDIPEAIAFVRGARVVSGHEM